MKNNESDGSTHATPSRNIIRVSDLLSPKDVAPYPERKDGWITITALTVIGGSALISGAALLFFPFWFPVCDTANSCVAGEAPDWAKELIRLSLVSSLAFVMGAQNGK